MGLASLSHEVPVRAPLLRRAKETFAAASLLGVVNVSQLTATVKERRPLQLAAARRQTWGNHGNAEASVTFE